MPAVNLGRGTRNSGRPGGWRYQHCFFVATFPSPSHLDVPTLLLRWHNHTSSGSLFSIVSSIFSSFPHVTRHSSRATSTYRLIASVRVVIAPFLPSRVDAHQTVQDVGRPNVFPSIHTPPFTSNLDVPSGCFSRSVRCPPFPRSFLASAVFNSLNSLKSFLVFSAGQLSQVVLMYRPVLPPFFVGPLLQAPWFDCTPRV